MIDTTKKLIKEIQEDKANVQEATIGKEVAISMPGVNFERQLKVGEVLYTNLSETEFRLSISFWFYRFEK